MSSHGEMKMEIKKIRQNGKDIKKQDCTKKKQRNKADKKYFEKQNQESGNRISNEDYKDSFDRKN